MEVIIIWLIVLGFAVYNSTKKKNARSKTQYSQNYQRPQNYRQPQNYQRSQGTPPYGGGNINPAQIQAEMARKQQELKSRLQQKYGGREAGANARPMQQNIPYRGAQQPVQQNVPYRGTQQPVQPRPVQQPPRQNMNPASRQQPGAMQQNVQNKVPQQPVQPRPVQQKDIMDRAMANVKENEVDELEKSGELMEQVNDLMIMGYQAKLSFGRDFVGEGIDMINSYELPNGMEQQD